MSAVMSASTLYAIDPSYYATTSALASGRWVKVKTTGNGMQLVTDAQLRSMGFNDPSKVNVYGMGGRQLNTGLYEKNPDDMPRLLSVHTSKGLVFFAADNITWTATPTSSQLPYSHTIHQYSDDTWYFLSDSGADRNREVAVKTVASKGANSITTFAERVLHESELEPAGESGSQIWGEDFRSKKSQTFSFTFPDMVDDEVLVNVRFAAKTLNGSSSIIMSANNKRLPATATDKIPDSKNDLYGRVTETIKTITGIDGKLDLKIDYSYSGVLFKARLDYIEAFYNRHLKLNGGEIHFYANLASGQGVTVSGCSAATQIWDVTDPSCPVKVEYVLEGDKASFSAAIAGSYEFVAFNPEAVSRQVAPAGEVANQNLHGLPTPDMLIITYNEYLEGAEKIARLHRDVDGMRVHVVTPDEIYNEFSGGKPDVGAFRRLLKMWYDRGADDEGHSIRYALLMGKTFYDNKMAGSAAKSLTYKPMPIWQSYEGLMETESYSNDVWIGMLDDVMPDRFSIKNGEIQVAVGRIPCKSSREALTVANKLEKYVKTPDYGEWRNKVMIIADDEDKGQHLRQAQQVYDAMRSAGNGGSFIYDRNYLDSYPRVMTSVGATYPQATQRMLDNYNEGVLFTNYIGHASPTGWGHEHLWEWPSIQSMSNNRLTFIYAATCSFAYHDDSTVSGAEHLLTNPNGGIIGIIAAARTVYISLNGDLNRATMLSMFERAEDGGPLRWGDVFVKGQNRINDSNSLRYCLLGDPALRIGGGSNSVKVTAINGREPGDDPNNYPELAAMSTATVEGVILKADGNVDTEYNGVVNLQLYDGERVITTLANGSQGEEISYNDRDKRLSATNATVKAGQWKAVLRIPPEIQGNYTTALISCYAWSKDGREANGSTDKLYVYGFNESSDDTDGPDIEAFYVNNQSLAQGAVVSRNMTVFARLRDKSGINVSQSGIGHSLTLCLDGKEYIDGIAQYFTHDLEDPDLGSLVFPLTDVAPGRHTLTLTAWDNANNVSTSSIDIEVAAVVDPTIYDITVLANEDSASLDFLISIDRPNSQLDCEMGIFDLNGRRLWSQNEMLNSNMSSIVTTNWDLCDSSGRRVPRGIYIFRARIEAPDGAHSVKSKKIAISAAETR